MHTLEFDGLTLTNDVEVLSYSVQYVEVQGKNGGTMLDGSTVYDILATKAVISVTLHPKTATAQAAILAKCVSTPTRITASLTYFDPKANASRTIDAKPLVRQTQIALRMPEYWRGLQLIFREV